MEEEEPWKHHDALPLLQGSTRRTENEIRLERREPQPRHVFWAFSPWPSPDTCTPPDIFLLNHWPPGFFHSFTTSQPPDLFIKVPASRSQPLSSAFVGVHTQHLGPLTPLFRPPFISPPSSPYKFCLKPSLHFSSLLSLLSLAYSSSPLSKVTYYCPISCVEDLVDIFDIATSLNLSGLRSAFSEEPLLSIISRFKLNQRRIRTSHRDSFRGAKARLYGFSLTQEDREHLNMVFLDIHHMPYRTKFLQDGLLILNDIFLFVQDVTKIIVPRGDRPMRSYCLLVPKCHYGRAIYSFFSFLQFVTFNAQVEAQMVGYRRALSFLVCDEVCFLSVRPPICELPLFNNLAKACELKATKEVSSSRQEGENFALVEYSGSMERVQKFLLFLFRFWPLFENTSGTLKMQRLSYKNFLCLFGMIDICHFSFLKHMAIINDKLYYLCAIVSTIQESYPSVLNELSALLHTTIPKLPTNEELPTNEARRIVEVCDD